MNKPLVQKLLVIGLLVTGFVLRWLALQQSEFANGWDTYYYLIQLASFQNTGEMHSPEWNLFYPFLIVADWFFTDSVTAVKFLSASLTVLLMYAFYLLAIQLKIRFEYILLLLALLLFSPELTYFASQWPKNLLGIIVYVLLLTALVKRSWYFIIALLIVSFFAHRMAAVLGLITVALWIFNKKINLRLKIGIVTLGLLSLGIFHFVPGLISFYDFERFNSLLSTQLQLPHLSFFHLFETEKTSIWWRMEMILSILFFSFVIGKLIRQLIKNKAYLLSNL